MPETGPAATPGLPASYKGVRAVVRHPAMRHYDGKDLDNGQVFMLKGLPNDDRLVRLGFVERLEQSAETHACPRCGATFGPYRNGPNGARTRDAHCRARHEVREREVVAEASAADIPNITEDKDGTPLYRMGTEPDNDPGESTEAPPLYLDQTAAERGVKADTPITI